MPKYLKSFYDFRGGLQTDAAPDNVLDNELVVADNVNMDERGGITKRKGTVRLNEVSYGAQVEQLFEWPRDDGTEQLMAVVGDQLARIAPDGTKTDVQQVASRKVGYFFLQDKLYFVDGEEFRAFDGQDVEVVDDGIPEPPTTAPTVEGYGPEPIDPEDPDSGYDNPTQIRSGYYRYAVAFCGEVIQHDGSWEPVKVSELGPIEETDYITEGSELHWSNIPTGPQGTAGRVLYRSISYGNKLHRVAVIPDNTTTEYVDRVPDNILEQSAQPSSDRLDGSNLDDVRKCRYIVRHTNSFRIFAAGNPNNPAAVYFSEPNEPGLWAETSVLYPTTADGPVKGLMVFGDALLVFYEHSIWAWRGFDPENDATWMRLPTGVGTVNSDTVALTPNTLTFLGHGGIYAISPAVIGMDVTIEPGSGIVRNITENKVGRIIRSITNPEYVVATFDSTSDLYMLAYRDDEGAPGDRNTRVLVFDWTLGAFARYTNLFINDFCRTRDGRLLAATDNYIIQMNVGYTDHDGSAIPMRFRTKDFNLDYPFHNKRFFRLYLAFRQPIEGDVTVTARVFVDGVVRFEVAEKALNENFVWGESDWGAVWGWKELVTSRLKISESGHRVQVEFSNDQPGVATTIYGVAFEFRPIRAKGMRL